MFIQETKTAVLIKEGQFIAYQDGKEVNRASKIEACILSAESLEPPKEAKTSKKGIRFVIADKDGNEYRLTVIGSYITDFYLRLKEYAPAKGEFIQLMAIEKDPVSTAGGDFIPRYLCLYTKGDKKEYTLVKGGEKPNDWGAFHKEAVKEIVNLYGN